MKLWQKSSSSISESIEAFTVGKDRELDLYLARYDILGSLAHVNMLHEVGLLETSELNLLQQGLRKIMREVDRGTFVIEEGIEDVHSQVEFMLTRELGDVGKKIHSGRSRNDQVLVDLKLYFLAEISGMVEGVSSLFQLLQKRSEAHRNDLMPGYTHTQVAMPSSFGLWFGAFAEALTDDLRLLLAAWEVCHQNPLGSAAGYGSSFPLDRNLTTRLLGFRHPAVNVVYAQMGRGKTEQVLAFSLAALGATLNKLATDVVLFTSQNFGFMSLPDALTTGSSIMPHKKNPDVFELLRARTARLQSLPGRVASVTTNLISGYHRDLQLVKEDIIPAIEDIKSCLHITSFAVENISVHPEVLENPIYDYLFTVEEVNRLVLQGVPFRDAYVQVGDKVETGSYVPNRNLAHAHLGSIGNLGNEKIREKFEACKARFETTKVFKAWAELLSES